MRTGQLCRRRGMRHALAFCAPVALVLALALAGCGQTVATGGAPSVPTATATAATTLTGCPAATQTVTWPAPPTVVLTTPLPSSATTIRAGQTLEVALPFGHVWRFTDGSEQPALTLDSPAGYGDSGAGRCIWHFTAQQAGQVTLSFTMAALCPAHTACPLYVAIMKAPISVIVE